MAKKTSKSSKASAKSGPARSARAARALESEEEMRWAFGPKNYIIFAIALVVIIIGFVTLGNGSMTLAPFLLAVGYCVLIPIAIMAEDKSKKDPAGESTKAPGQATG